MVKAIFTSILLIFYLLRRGIRTEGETHIHTGRRLVPVTASYEIDGVIDGKTEEFIKTDSENDNTDYKEMSEDVVVRQEEESQLLEGNLFLEASIIPDDPFTLQKVAEMAIISNGIQNTSEALRLLKHLNRKYSTSPKYNELLFPLLSAENNSLIAELILQNVVDVYFADKKGNTALHYAAMNDNSVLAFDICEKDASGINNQNDFRETAFIIATSRNNTKICRILLDRDADPYIPNADGLTSLHEAVMNKNREIVQFILSKSIRGIDEVDYKGDTALSLAAMENDHILAEVLVKAGTDPYIQNFEGLTSLHLAVKVKSELIVSALLKENRSGINLRNKNGETPLLCAVFRGLLSIVKILLIYEADPNIANFLGVSPLHAASTIGNAGILKSIFIESKPDPNLQDEKGNTTLHYAVNMQHIQMVSVLLEMGADPKVANNNNRTSLHTAAILGDQDISVVLLNASISVLDVPDHLGQTALHLSVFFGQSLVVETLLKFRANPNAVDSSGFNALRSAAEVIRNKKNSTDTPEPLKIWLQIISNLLRFGSDPYISDLKHTTTLHVAAEIGSVEIVSMILEHSTRGINIQNSAGMTALNLAIFNKNINVAIVLLENFANPYIQDNYGRTSLHLAAGRGAMTLISEILAKNNSGVNMEDIRGNTALCYAISFPYMMFPDGRTTSYIAEDNVQSFVPVGILIEGVYYGSKNRTTMSVLELREFGLSLFPESKMKRLLQSAYKIIKKEIITYKANEFYVAPKISSYSSFEFVENNKALVCGLFGKSDSCIPKHDGEFSSKRAEIVTFLINKHADYGRTNVETDTVFQNIVENDDLDVFGYFVKYSGITAKNNKGETYLHTAIRKSAFKISKYLLESGVDPYLSDDRGRTALHAAAEMHNLEIMKSILNTSKDGINLKDNIGLTALSLSTARARKVKELCKLLIDHGADPYEADNGGNTALHAAVIEKVQLTLYNDPFEVFGQITDLMKAGYDEPHRRQVCFQIFDSSSCNKTMCHLYSPYFEDHSVTEMLLRCDPSGINLKNDQGYTALFSAALYSSLDLQILIDLGADPYIVDNEGHTSVHALVASYSNKSTAFQDLGLLIKILASNNSGVNMQDSFGFTALHYAAFTSSGATYFLLKYGADTNIADNLYGWTPLHVAVKYEHLNIVRYIMDDPKTNIDAQNDDGQTPLHIALADGIAHVLIWKGADVKRKDRRGWTFLHYSVFHGRENMISEILNKNSSGIDDVTLLGETPLSIATARNNYNMVKYLLEKGAVSEFPRDYMKSPIEIAVSENNFQIFELLSEGLDNLLSYNWFGLNVLHIASWQGNLDIVAMIIEKFKTNIDYPDRYGHTALHYAAMGSNEAVIDYLLKQGANPSATDNFGQCVLHYAAEGCSRSSINSIWQRAKEIVSKNELIQFINRRNFLDITSLQFSAFNGNWEVFEFLWNEGAVWNDSSYASYHNILIPAALGGNKKIIDFILNKTSLSVVEKTANGHTPAMEAAARGRREAFEVLISKGARIDDVSYYGQTMLHFAAQGGDKKIIETVLNKSTADINSRDVEGFTPLMNAVYHDKLRAVEFLLNNNADPHIKNIYGEDAIKIAAKVGNAVLKSKLFNVTDNIDNAMGILLARKNASFDRQILFDLVAKSSLRKHPIFLAAAKGDITSIETLLSSSVKIRKRSFPNLMKELMNDFDTVINDMKENEENTPSNEERLSPLDIALFFHQNLPVVKTIIQILHLDEKSINYKAKTWTPLDYALMANSKLLNDSTTDVLLYLLNRCKNVLNESTNDFGWTAAHKAAWFGNSQAIGFLHYYGVDLNKADNFGRTPLHYAALNGHSQAVNKILHFDKVSINKKDKHGFTPLLLAQIYYHRKFFKRLSYERSDLPSKEKFSLVQISDFISKISKSNDDDYFLTTLSLIALKADLDVQDKAFGWTALHWAAVNGDYQSVQLLVSGGAKVNLLSWTGETPLLIARKWMREQTYNYLKSKNGVW